MSVGRYIRGKFKKILKSDNVTKSISWLLAKYLTFVYKTSKWESIGLEHAKEHIDKSIPILGAFWHNRLGMMTYAWIKDDPFYMMISSHGDGKLISDIVSYHGISTIHGSTTRGGASAMRNAVLKLKEGHCVGITPDGPRGPRYTVQQGAINIARKAEVDIFTCAYCVTNRIVFNSWDKFIFPLPFSKGVYVYSKALKYEEFKDKESTEKAYKKLQKLMIKAASDADRYCGYEPMTIGKKRVKKK